MVSFSQNETCCATRKKRQAWVNAKAIRLKDESQFSCFCGTYLYLEHPLNAKSFAAKYLMCRVFGHACTSGPTCWSGWITTPSNERTIEGTVKVSDQELPRWVTIKQAAEYYQLDPKTIRRMITQDKLKARRVGERSIRVDRESLLGLGRVKYWGT
jgi:excisionase family DNA binding protein